MVYSQSDQMIRFGRSNRFLILSSPFYARISFQLQNQTFLFSLTLLHCFWAFLCISSGCARIDFSDPRFLFPSFFDRIGFPLSVVREAAWHSNRIVTEPSSRTLQLQLHSLLLLFARCVA